MTIRCVEGEEEQGTREAIVHAKEHYEESRLELDRAVNEAAARALALLEQHGFKASFEPKSWTKDGTTCARIRLDF
jgi:hypothetical protein